VDDDILRCRISDLTGVFDIVIPGPRSEIFKKMKEIPVPSFVAITGMAKMVQTKGAKMVSVYVESVQAVDRTARDNWVLRTADMTLDRLEQQANAMQGQLNDLLIRKVMEHYHTTPETVREFVDIVGSALSGIQAPAPSIQPAVNVNELILAIIKEHQGKSGISVQDVIAYATRQGISSDSATNVIKDLIIQDECYQPQKGILKLL
jgi:hypothetical protein